MLKGAIQMENSTEYSKMMRAIWNEKKLVASWIKQYDIDGIISIGVLTKNVPSVYITHQLNVMTGNNWLTE
jgi:hypothetical protein